MSYCYYVKPSENVPNKLLKYFNIPAEPVIIKGDSRNRVVAKLFVNEIVSVGHRIADMLKTNVPMNLTQADFNNHDAVLRSGRCNMYSNKFKFNNGSVKDHNHLIGKYRQTISKNCNMN